MSTSGGLGVTVRIAVASDLADLLRIHRLAFGDAKVADLVAAMLRDPSARPVLSLLAVQDDRAVGHILFTRARLTAPDSPHGAAILAPLGVVPDAQRRGVGEQLVAAGLRQLSDAGVDLVFVLGHPAYYQRHGFQPAGRLGLAAPHPIPEEHADAWMVHALRPGLLGSLRGAVLCSDVLGRPEHWRSG
jgi:putative acetyltransferase